MSTELIVIGAVVVWTGLVLMLLALMRAAAMPTPPPRPLYRVTYCPRCRYSQITPHSVRTCYLCDGSVYPVNSATHFHEVGPRHYRRVA